MGTEDFNKGAFNMARPKSSDPWAILVIVLTIGLFVVAPFLKRFTHDLFLEAGVFLVSVKLILMAKKNAETESRLEQHLVQIKEFLARTGSERLGSKER
jgi:hypothetical protein